MKKTKVISARIDSSIKELADAWCQSRGLLFGHFLEEAILSKLEDEDDLAELNKIRKERRSPLESVLKKLGLTDG